MIVTPRVVLLEVGWEALVFWPFFPAPSFRFLIFPFIFAGIQCHSSTYGVDIPKADICLINPYSKSLGVVVKSQRMRLCQVQSIEWQQRQLFLDILGLSSKFRSYAVFTLPLVGTMGLPGTELSPAVPKDHFVGLGP